VLAQFSPSAVSSVFYMGALARHRPLNQSHDLQSQAGCASNGHGTIKIFIEPSQKIAKQQHPK